MLVLATATQPTDEISAAIQYNYMYHCCRDASFVLKIEATFNKFFWPQVSTIASLYCWCLTATMKRFLWSRNLPGRQFFVRFIVFPCRKVQVFSIRKLNGKMLLSLLESAETSTTPTLPPTDLTSVTSVRRGETLPGQMNQPGFIHPPTSMETLLETWLLHFLFDFRFRNVSKFIGLKLFCPQFNMVGLSAGPHWWWL